MVIPLPVQMILFVFAKVVNGGAARQAQGGGGSAGGPPGAHPGPACGAVRTARLQIRVQPPPAQADGDGQGVGRERKERVDCHGEASGSKALEADFLGPYGGGT